MQRVAERERIHAIKTLCSAGQKSVLSCVDRRLDGAGAGSRHDICVSSFIILYDTLQLVDLGNTQSALALRQSTRQRNSPAHSSV
jgi:hypothetical protein